MEKIPRHIDIDYSKYAPDIPEDQREAYYGLPKHVQFCKECVMSNQKPNSSFAVCGYYSTVLCGMQAYGGNFVRKQGKMWYTV